MPSSPSASPVAEGTVADSAPLPTEIVDALTSRLLSTDAVALRDSNNKIFAVLLTRQRFNLLQMLSDLAASERLVLEPKQESGPGGPPRSLLDFIENLEK